MLFKSAIDWWFYALIAVLAIVLLIVIVPAFSSGRLSAIGVSGFILLSLGLPIWLLFSTNYQVLDELLRIRSGPFKWNIKLSEIHSVEFSRSALSSPALSLDRLEIVYGKNKRILVSPADREGFIAAINQSNNGT